VLVLIYSGCGGVTMIKPTAFARKHNAASAEESLCLKCFVTISTVEGGPDLREMERRHKCDPMNLFYSRETAAGTAFTRKESEYFLSVPKTIGAGEQQEIIRRIRSRVAKRELVARNRTRSSFWDKN